MPLGTSKMKQLLLSALCAFFMSTAFAAGTLDEELEKNNSNIDINRIREIITEFQSGKDMTNEFLKEIIYHIEIYSNDRIDIIFNL